MRFNFRKIASAAASIAMMGSTIGLAAAANYPAPFVTGGAGDVALVYGSGSASSDIVAAVDITASLQSFITSDGGSGTTIEGESYALFTSSTKIYLNDSINKARTVVSKNNMPTVLKDGSFEGDVTATYTQKIDIGSTSGTNSRLLFGQHPTSDDDPTIAFDLGTTKGNSIYNLTVTFNKAVDFNSSDSIGENLNLFGQDLTVGAETTGGKGGSLIFLKSAAKVNLNSETNPSEQVTIDDQVYTVELVSASDNAATIRVTDSSGNSDTKEINEDTSKTIQGLEVSVTTADETNFALSATVTLGAEKIKLTDNSAVKLGSDEDTVDGSNVRFGSDGSQRPNNITKIVFQISAEDSDIDAIVEGGEFVDPVFGSLKLTFPQVTIPEDSTDRELFSIDNSGSDKMTEYLTEK